MARGRALWHRERRRSSGVGGGGGGGGGRRDSLESTRDRLSRLPAVGKTPEPPLTGHPPTGHPLVRGRVVPASVRHTAYGYGPYTRKRPPETRADVCGSRRVPGFLFENRPAARLPGNLARRRTPTEIVRRAGRRLVGHRWRTIKTLHRACTLFLSSMKRKPF